MVWKKSKKTEFGTPSEELFQIGLKMYLTIYYLQHRT